MAKKGEKVENHIIDVQPIRDKQQLEDMGWALRRHCSERDYILFLVGINTGLRVSDLLAMKTDSIFKLRNKRAKVFKVREGKTQKVREVNLTPIYDEVYAYASTLSSEWLFPSRKGDKPISPIQAYRQLQKAGDMAGVQSIGTHTMRKTFGYWMYKSTHDVAMLQGILNHTKPEVTLKYIGITQEETNNVLNNFRLL